MSAHVLPENVAADLGRLASTTELGNSSGRVIGFFIPAVDPSEYEIIGDELTPEELERIRQSDEWYTTEEVLRHLESLK